MPCEEDSPEESASRNPLVAQWNSKIVLVTRIGKGIIGVDVPVMIKEISVYCKARVQLELSPNLPFISRLQFSLLEPPKVDFILKPLKSFDLMDLPGLSSWLTNTINDVLQDKVVDPNMIDIPISKRYSDVQSIGVVKVTLYQMRGIKMLGNLSEPFVRLQMAGKVKGISKSISASNPEWNETFYLLLHSLSNPIVFVVHGANKGVIGSTTLPISDIDRDAGSSSNVWRTIVGHESSKVRGELNLGVEYFSVTETPDPEADLNFESGIVQITIHQVKDIVVTEKKTLNCCYELFIHPTNTQANITSTVSNGLDNCYYRSKNKKKGLNPSWDDRYEVFLEYKDQMSVTLVVRHATKEDIIFAQWTCPFINLLNRTDWFSFEGSQTAQFFASFIFRPVRVDLTTAAPKRAFSPAIGIVRLHIVSASGLKAAKGGYQAVAHMNGMILGKSRISLSESDPVWNKTLLVLLKDRHECIFIDVVNCEKKSKVGSVSLAASELLNHPGCDIDKHEELRGEHSDKLIGKLRFSGGLFLKETSGVQVDETHPVLSEDYDSRKSNAGILELRSVSVEGVDSSGIDYLDYVSVIVGDGIAACKTSSVRIGIEGIQEWSLDREFIILDPEMKDLTFALMETHGARDEVTGIARISLADAKSGESVSLEAHDGATTEIKLKFKAQFHVAPLFVEAEAEQSGLLTITLHEAKDLIAVDSGGTSDPFCVLRLNGSKFYKSQVIKKCLAPVFDETIKVEIKQKDASVLQIELRDWNLVAASRTLGHISLELQNIAPGEPQKLNMPLENVSSGFICFTAEFTPKEAQKSRRRKETPAIAVSQTNTDTAPLPAISEALPLSIPAETILKKADTTTPSTPQATSSARASTLTLLKASGLKITIVKLELPADLKASGDCKIKVRRNNRTLFKTREIKHAPYRWNESFTIDSSSVDVEASLTLIASWAGQDLDCEVKLYQLASELEERESEMERKLSCGSSGEFRLIIRYTFTMDTGHMLDQAKKRRFSLFNH